LARGSAAGGRVRGGEPGRGRAAGARGTDVRVGTTRPTGPDGGGRAGDAGGGADASAVSRRWIRALSGNVVRGDCACRGRVAVGASPWWESQAGLAGRGGRVSARLRAVPGRAHDDGQQRRAFRGAARGAAAAVRTCPRWAWRGGDRRGWAHGGWARRGLGGDSYTGKRLWRAGGPQGQGTGAGGRVRAVHSGRMDRVGARA